MSLLKNNNKYLILHIGLIILMGITTADLINDFKLIKSNQTNISRHRSLDANNFRKPHRDNHFKNFDNFKNKNVIFINTDIDTNTDIYILF